MGSSLGWDLAHNVISATIIEALGAKRIIAFPEVVKHTHTHTHTNYGRASSRQNFVRHRKRN